METENWYLRHKARIMREVRFAFRHYRKPLAEAYGKAEGKAIAEGDAPGLRGPPAGPPLHRR